MIRQKYLFVGYRVMFATISKGALPYDLAFAGSLLEAQLALRSGDWDGCISTVTMREKPLDPGKKSMRSDYQPFSLVLAEECSAVSVPLIIYAKRALTNSLRPFQLLGHQWGCQVIMRGHSDCDSFWSSCMVTLAELDTDREPRRKRRTRKLRLEAALRGEPLEDPDAAHMAEREREVW